MSAVTLLTIIVIAILFVLIAVLSIDLSNKPNKAMPAPDPKRTPRAYLGEREVEIVEIGPAFVTVRYLDTGREAVAKRNKVMVLP
jgi:hypothetical protein